MSKSYGLVQLLEVALLGGFVGINSDLEGVLWFFVQDCFWVFGF
jgi:hypothetical protein